MRQHRARGVNNNSNASQLTASTPDPGINSPVRRGSSLAPPLGPAQAAGDISQCILNFCHSVVIVIFVVCDGANVRVEAEIG